MLKALALGLSCSFSLLGCETLVVRGADSGANDDDGGSVESDADTSGSVCGDGFSDPGETCDDGNLVSGDGCSSVCLDETLACIPSSVGEAYDLGGQGGRMVGEAGRLYVAASRNENNPKMRILDVSNPNAISEMGSFQFTPDERPNAKTLGIVKRGELVFLAGSDPALTAVDVSNPASTSLAFDRLNPSSDGHLVRVGANHLLVSQSVSERPALYDISGGSADFVTFLGDPGDVYYNVGASQTHAFASTFSNTVDIFRSEANPMETEVVGRYSHPDSWSSSNGVQKIVADGNLMAFSVTVAGPAQGVHLIDIGNPSAPVLRVTIPEQANDLILSQGFLYLTHRDGIKVFDVQNPQAPVPAGSIVEFDFGSTSLAIDGPNAFIVGEDKLMAIAGLPGLCQPVCGNNTREYPETCDDGNRDDGDSCSADCAQDL